MHHDSARGTELADEATKPKSRAKGPKHFLADPSPRTRARHIHMASRAARLASLRPPSLTPARVWAAHAGARLRAGGREAPVRLLPPIGAAGARALLSYVPAASGEPGGSSERGLDEPILAGAPRRWAEPTDGMQQLLGEATELQHEPRELLRRLLMAGEADNVAERARRMLDSAADAAQAAWLGLAIAVVSVADSACTASLSSFVMSGQLSRPQQTSLGQSAKSVARLALLVADGMAPKDGDAAGKPKEDAAGKAKEAQKSGAVTSKGAPPEGRRSSSAGGSSSNTPAVPGLARASSPRSNPPASSRAPASSHPSKSSARGEGKAAQTGRLPSARANKPKANPLGGVSAASARVMKGPTSDATSDAGPPQRPASQPASSGGGQSTNRAAPPPRPQAPQQPRKQSPRASSLGGGGGGGGDDGEQARRRPGGNRKQEEPTILDNPCMCTQPVPPLPPDVRRPPMPVVSPAGPRPRGRQDGAPSRHELAPTLGVSLLFNCFKAKFEVISGDVSTLSDHDPFDLKGPRSGQSLGRIKISPEKGTSLIDRVEFPNVWLSAEQHGCVHDGFQGEGALDLKVSSRHTAIAQFIYLLAARPFFALFSVSLCSHLCCPSLA